MTDLDGEPEPAVDPDQSAAAVPVGALILRDEALRRGVNAEDVKRRLERGQWIALRPGVYLRSSTYRAMSQRQQHLLRIDATMADRGSELVVSHTSAACLHGLEQLQIPGRVVSVTKPSANAGRHTTLRHTYCAPLDPDEITVVNGHPVTSPARTVVDIARSRPFEEALVVADHALRLGLVTAPLLQATVDRAPRRRGVRSAQQVILFADGRAESAGESRSRLLIARQLLPAPDLQVRVRTCAGSAFARSDFGWREFGTVGEFDGMTKYGRGLVPGECIGDRVVQETAREDRIRDLGWNVVRWTWPELDDPVTVGDRIRRALVRGGLAPGR